MTVRGLHGGTVENEDNQGKTNPALQRQHARHCGDVLDSGSAKIVSQDYRTHNRRALYCCERGTRKRTNSRHDLDLDSGCGKS